MASKSRYQTHSNCKLLIYKGFEICIIFRQANKSLDLQGPAGPIDHLSTKLSTENLDDWQNPKESTT
jgi:hypothetical protein